VAVARRPDYSLVVGAIADAVGARAKSAGAGPAKILFLTSPNNPTGNWLMPVLWKFKQPYNVNVAASVAGIASLRHVDQIAAVVAKLNAERSRLYALLDSIPWIDPCPRACPFLLLCSNENASRFISRSCMPRAQGATCTS
jgi:histidinol-phosphate/aromatic aminotransferase/cobyric acid decarboxylase-like protein